MFGCRGQYRWFYRNFAVPWRGACSVIAVDVGTNQLTDELKRDARVLSLEQTDIRALRPVAPVDLIVIDVSFISLINIMDALVAWKSPQIIALIKPQFEVPRAVATGKTLFKTLLKTLKKTAIINMV